MGVDADASTQGVGPGVAVRSSRRRARDAELPSCGWLHLEAEEGTYGKDWLTPLRELAAKSETDALRAAVAVAVAMSEAQIGSYGWYPAHAEVYLSFLADLGYELDDYEREQVSEGKRRPARAADAGRAVGCRLRRRMPRGGDAGRRRGGRRSGQAGRRSAGRAPSATVPSARVRRRRCGMKRSVQLCP